MSSDRRSPIAEHLPRGEPSGRVLVISDYRRLNLGHAALLCTHGYAVYTAVTCTDVSRIFEAYTVEGFDLIVFASLVHGWHHREGEKRPEGTPAATDPEWHTRNMREVISIVSGRQGYPPRVLIAADLMTSGWYTITADALEAVGVECHTYPASDPKAILDSLG
jgi:hypothetical protein